MADNTLFTSTLTSFPPTEALWNSIKSINGNFSTLIKRNQDLAENKMSDPLKVKIKDNTKEFAVTSTSLALNATTITLASTSGLAPGMLFTGFVPNVYDTNPFLDGTTISSIDPSKKTITLSNKCLRTVTIPSNTKARFINVASEDLKEEGYNVLTWDSSTTSWVSKEFQGYMDISARAWVVFEVTLTSPYVKILAKYNVSTVAKDPGSVYPTKTNANLTEFLPWKVTLTKPYSVPEACVVVSGYYPEEKKVNPPQAVTYGLPYNGDQATKAKKTVDGYGRFTPPETVYGVDLTTAKYNPIPEIYRNNFYVFWKPDNYQAPVGSIISAILYTRSYGTPGYQDNNAVTTLLGNNISEFYSK